jgi:hypothetical protein
MHDETEYVATLVDSGRMNNGLMTPRPPAVRDGSMTGQASDREAEVSCEALKVALCAVQMYIAWHAGVISAEIAMGGIDREIGEVTSRCANRLEVPRSPSPQGTAAEGNTAFIEYMKCTRVGHF